MKKNTFYVQTFFLLFLFLFFCFAFIAVAFPINGFDLNISTAIQSTRNPALDRLMIFISVFGEPEILLAWTAGMVLLFAIARHSTEAKYTTYTLLAYPLSTFVKHIFNRPRPMMPHVFQLGAPLTDPSFPSSHVLLYTVFFGMLLICLVHAKQIPRIVRWYLGFLCVFLIVAIPFSRIYVGAHWYTDTLAGYCAGFIYVLLLHHWYIKELKSHHSHTPHQ